MPAIRTELTEIVTGLGTLGFSSVQEGLVTRPAEMVNVENKHWDRLEEAIAGGEFDQECAGAWDNGIAFLRAKDGLRGRRPLLIEWKGPHQTPGYDLIPADLRIDHVFLVSCKYLSAVLFNASPSHLFDRVLADRHGGDRTDWYSIVAPDAYGSFYSDVRTEMASNLVLPHRVQDLTREHRDRLKKTFEGAWPPGLRDSYRAFCSAVSLASAKRWVSRLSSAHAREEMLWRLLRIYSAPYFVLGTSGSKLLQLRIYTPWDWHQEYILRSLDVWGDGLALQPLVRWRAIVRRRTDGADLTVNGHVEIRWSHGRFCGSPEAKVYLDTPHDQVPGYVALC